MLHRLKPFFWELLLFSYICTAFLTSCKSETSSHGEDESAYMADYETPSDHWGFIDSQGNMIIEAAYDDVGPFSEGLAAVNKNGKWGFIDQKGEMVIDPIYKSAWAFHEGFARVQPFDSLDQFIDRKGIAIPAKSWSAADDFSDGRARVKVGNTFGYVDTSGKLIIQPLYTRGWNFSKGSCIVEYHEKHGLINGLGEAVLKPEFDHIKKAARHKIILCKKGDAAIAYDDDGNELVRIPGGKMVDSDGELISVRQGKNMFLITVSSPTILSKAFSNIIYLEENLWAGKVDSGYLILDKAGNPINAKTYNQINKFSEGFAAYSKDDFWGYLDTLGRELTGEVFGLAWDYKEGYARAAFRDGIAFIDYNQKLAFYPPNGSLDMRDFSEGLAAVKID